MLKFDWNILFTLANLLIFFLLMKKFFFGKIIKVMDERKALVEKKFKDAEDANNEALELKKQYENQLESAEKESSRIISEAKENAKTEYGKILTKAEADAEKVMATAKKESEEEREAVLRSAKEDIASLAIKTAEKIISKNVSEKTDSDIFDEFLNESSDK